MTTERRKSDPEYRDLVHRLAAHLLSWSPGDYDRAVEVAAQLAVNPGEQIDHDVLALLTRRANTVAGISQPEAHVYGDGSNHKRDWRQPK